MSYPNPLDESLELLTLSNDYHFFFCHFFKFFSIVDKSLHLTISVFFFFLFRFEWNDKRTLNQVNLTIRYMRSMVQITWIKGRLKIWYLGIGHPTTRFDLIGVETPKVEFFFEQRPADVRGIMELSSAIIVENLSEDSRVPIEEVFVEDWVVVREGFSQPREPRRWDFLQGRLICFMPDPTHVKNYAVLRVHVY